MSATSSPYEYPPGFTRDVLNSVHSIAVVGASADRNKFSFDVISLLLERGHAVFAVNPRCQDSHIAGAPVYPSLEAIPEPVDMVDVFRPSAELYGVTEQAIAIGAKVLWAQLEVYDGRAAALATEAGLTVVMDRCPKIELQPEAR